MINGMSTRGTGLLRLQCWSRCQLVACQSIHLPRQKAGPSTLQRRRLHVARAKKKSKGKGGQKKGPGSLMDLPVVDEDSADETPPGPATEAKEFWQTTDVIMQNLLLVESFWRNVGRPLLEDVELENITHELWNAPFALLAHDLPEDEAAGEPLFSYANQAALDLFEAEWDELIGKPSTISTDSGDQADRSHALASAMNGGVVEGVTGWRRSLKGKRFQIENATVFNISGPTGDVLGQGARIGQWSFEDGSRAGPDAALDAPAPGPADLELAEQEVEQQASKVRALKEGQGLGNDDPAVQEAVAELLALKQRLEDTQGRLAQAT